MTLPVTPSALSAHLVEQAQRPGPLSAAHAGELYAAVSELVRVLGSAPRDGDRAAAGIWANHERQPALNALADVLDPAGAAERAADIGAARRRDADLAQRLRRTLRA